MSTWISKNIKCKQRAGRIEGANKNTIGQTHMNGWYLWSEMEMQRQIHTLHW